MNDKRIELIKKASGPLPPFIKDLRAAIRAGIKTQTRRIIKPQPYQDENGHWFFDIEGFSSNHVPDYMLHRCNYGQAGQVRYLREPLIKGADGLAHFRDDDGLCLDEFGGAFLWRWQKDTLPQIFMPKTVARTFVQLDAIRGERLWEISESDAKAEGVAGWHDTINGTVYKPEFQMLWEQINAARGYSWTENWWLWVLVFETIFPIPLKKMQENIQRLTKSEYERLYFGTWDRSVDEGGEVSDGR